MSKAYIWEEVSPVSINYHDRGGLLVVARSLVQAREYWKDYAIERLGRGDRVGGKDSPLDQEPKHTLSIYDGASHDGLIIVFPDAGCC